MSKPDERPFQGTAEEDADRARLEDTVVPVVAPTRVAARSWRTPLGMVFIDGGHSLEAALTDYRSWSGHLVAGGILAIHDIFPDPADGGQAPWTIYQLALASVGQSHIQIQIFVAAGCLLHTTNLLLKIRWKHLYSANGPNANLIAVNLFGHIQLHEFGLYQIEKIALLRFVPLKILR